MLFTALSKTSFNLLEADYSIRDHYNLKSIQGFGLEEYPLGKRALGGLLNYLKNTNPSMEENSKSSNYVKIKLDPPKIKFPENSLIIDSQTRRNLELTSTQKDGQFKGSFLWAIDRTLTAMGGRCLRRWIEEPLIDKHSIIDRQDVVSILVKSKN